MSYKEKQCKQCGKNTRNRGEFCSKACFGLSCRKGVSKKCEIVSCNNVRYVKSYLTKRSKYCSRLCANQALGIGKTGRKVSETTKNKISLANSGQKFEKTCLTCKNIYLVTKCHLNKKYCSQSCFGVGVSGILAPRWKGGKENHKVLTIARRAMKRNAVGSYNVSQWENLKRKYNYMCLCCKKQEPFIRLSVDHIIPLIKGGSNDISNIQPLCLSCNSRKHTKIINFIPLAELSY